MPTPPALDEKAIDARLTGELEKWQHDNGWIRRTYKTGSWKSTLMIVNAVGHLAEAAWHHPDIEAGFPAVTINLQTHDAGGITERDIELATQIERLIMWKPGKNSALEGTPADERFQYIQYD